MSEERFTPAAIAAERPDLQPTGERYVELAYTGFAVAAVSPHHRLEVARYLRTLLTRPPVAAGPLYAAHREILGALVVEIEALTVQDVLDGPPLDETLDVRDPAAVAGERELIQATRDWAAGRRAETTTAYEEHIDRILAGEAEAHAKTEAELDAAVAATQDALEAPVQPAAAPEAADVSVWA